MYTREQKKRWDRLSMDQATRRYYRGVGNEPSRMIFPDNGEAYMNREWFDWHQRSLEHGAFIKYLKDRQRAELPYYTMGKAGSQEEAKPFDIEKLKIRGRSGQSVPTFVGEGTKTGGGASV